MNNQYDKIKEDVKLKISISNFKEKEKHITLKRVIEIAAVVCLISVSITGVVFANEIENYIKKLFGDNTSDGVESAVKNGYVEELNTEYQEAEGISVSIEEIIMDDFNFAINFKIDLDEKYDITEFQKSIIDDLMIQDETGKIVFNTHIAEFETEEMKGKTYMGGYNFLVTKVNDRELTLTLSATGNPDKFPRSKKLKINFTRIITKKYVNGELKQNIYKGNWAFDIDVPKEFYNRETAIYKAINCSEAEIDINKITATLSNTAFKVYIPEIKSDKIDYEAFRNYNGNVRNMMALRDEYIENSKGRKFEKSMRSDGDGSYGVPKDENKIIEYHNTFNLTKYDATEIIKLYIFTNKDEEITIEFKAG